jgi:glutamine---fructose-6-phosphate transaminase (isomerizing)
MGESVSLPVVQGQYLKDILEQPHALRATWQALRGSTAFDDVQHLLSRRKFDRLVLTGMGSSYFGLHPLALETAEHGWSPMLLETSELVHYYPHLLGPSTLVIAVSQSGQSAETLRLLQNNGNNHALVAVTNTADSALAHNADVTLLTHAGAEFSVSCKTYVSALMALSALSAAFCGQDTSARLTELEVASEHVNTYLRHCSEHVEELATELRDIRDLFLVGRGASLAAAETGALIIKESDHFHAEGMSSAAFRHGPFEMLTPNVFVGVFAGDERTRDLNERLASEMREQGARSALIGTQSSLRACRIPSVSQHLRPILEILPVEMITLALAALANREAGKFERATKVTAVE